MKKGKPRMPPVFRRFRAFWSAVYALYVLAFIGTMLLPAGYPWLTQENPAEISAFNILSTGKPDAPQLLQPLVTYLSSNGIRPRRLPWKPNGVDYGNTRTPEQVRRSPVYMAWQQNSKPLEAVPPGINVLAPRWFIVEDIGGRAVVNDVANVQSGKNTSWDPVQYITVAHAGGAKVWAQVACLSEPTLAKQLVTDAEVRGEFIGKLSGWVSQYGLDGVDFDFEKMDPADKELFTEFIAECEKALPEDVVVSVAVTVPLDNPSPTNWWQCYDREGLGRVADYIAVMAYDNPDMEPVDALDWVRGRIKSLLTFVPEDKILLGVPFYGVDLRFNIPKGTRLDAFPDLKKSNGRYTITPYTMQQLLGTGSCTIGKDTIAVDYWLDKGSWSDTEGMATYSFVDTNGKLHLMYCDDARSMREKAELLAFERLGGAAVWKLELGNDAMWNALIQSAAAQ